MTDVRDNIRELTQRLHPVVDRPKTVDHADKIHELQLYQQRVFLVLMVVGGGAAALFMVALMVAAWRLALTL